jgi:hypothetical protein
MRRRRRRRWWWWWCGGNHNSGHQECGKSTQDKHVSVLQLLGNK